jgi:hypothetical protein
MPPISHAWQAKWARRTHSRIQLATGHNSVAGPAARRPKTLPRRQGGVFLIGCGLKLVLEVGSIAGRGFCRALMHEAIHHGTVVEPSLPEAAVQFAAPRLPLLRLQLTFGMDEPVVLPSFRGNLWRGVLGLALKRIDEGILPGLCYGAVEPGTLYRTFFESPPPPDAKKMRRYEAAPHPYVVDAPSASAAERIEAGATLRIGLTLVGRPATALEAVLAAFNDAARAGLGRPIGRERRRGRGRLIEARAVWRGNKLDAVAFNQGSTFKPIMPEVPVILRCPGRLRVKLETPLRLERHGKLVDSEGLLPGTLVANLVRRISMMCEFYGDVPLDTDFRALKTMWEGLAAHEPKLERTGQKRWSSRSRQEIDLEGVTGSLVLDLRGREPLFPFLYLGQWVHAGKGATMGMGAIRLYPA